MNASHAATLQANSKVIDISDGIVEGIGEWPLIPAGIYRAVLVRHVCLEMLQFKGAAKVFLHFKIIDPGEHFGKVVYRAYRVRQLLPGGSTKPVINGRFLLYRRSELLLDYLRVMDTCTRPDRVSLLSMRRHVLKLKTRTVVKDSKQRPLPTALQYTVVDQIIGRETG